MFRKFPTKPIDEKKKTGDVEQLRIIWAVYQSVQESTDKWDVVEQKKLAYESLNTLTAEYETPAFLEDTFSRASKSDYQSYLPSFSTLQSLVPHTMEIREMLTTVYGKLGPPYKQFMVNLALFDYRTAGGGRARKSTNVLRSGAGEEHVYVRPFEVAFPYSVSAWLSILPRASSPVDNQSEDIPLSFEMSGAYVPPTRFTATFPLTLERKDADNEKKTLIAPHIPGKEHSGGSTIKYAYLGSFGFAESGYSEWGSDDGEYPGTRLSLGAYSLNPVYLEHLKFVMDSMDEKQSRRYAKYGGVGKAHVQVLMEKFGQQKGLQLAVTWVLQLAEIARALVTEAQKNSDSKLDSFFRFILEKIHKREEKLLEIQKHISDPEVFEYVWVFESTLWEFAFLGASCLSASAIRKRLGSFKFLETWQPSVGFSEGHEYDVQERVVFDSTPIAFERVYFPSGTGAATVLHELLLARHYKPRPFKLDKKKLSTFTPYFEFYLGTDSFLNEEQVSKLTQDMPKVQLWLNLSDGLHSELLGRKAGEAGVEIATLVSRFVAECVPDHPVCLVIDYTKITGDMPNSTLYPILAVMFASLVKQVKNLKRMVLLRSNLKYNTGSLDRYQSGEILVPRMLDTKKAPSKLAAQLSKRAVLSFSGQDVNVGRTGQLSKDWDMRGEYVPLMRKLYLLSDAITSGRWGEYAKLWA